MKKKNCSKNGHQFIWTTVFGLLDTRNLYFFFVPSYLPPTSPRGSADAVWIRWRKAIRRTARKLSEPVDFLGSLLTTWNTEEAFPRTAHTIVCPSRYGTVGIFLVNVTIGHGTTMAANTMTTTLVRPSLSMSVVTKRLSMLRLTRVPATTEGKTDRKNLRAFYMRPSRVSIN